MMLSPFFTKLACGFALFITTNAFSGIFDFGKTPLQKGETWLINFDSDDVGPYSWLQLYLDWSGPKWQMGRNLVSVVEGEDLAFSGKALQLTYPAGISSCKGRKRCINWPVDLGIKLDRLYYGYRFKMPENFEFIKGGKLPGVAGGKGNAGGQVPTGRDGWSVRMMWDGKGRLVQYVYHPEQKGQYGDVLYLDTGGAIELGVWHTVQTLVELNTPGKHNGRIITWLDGKKVLTKEKMRFRDVNRLKISRFQFISFFGGNGPDWAPRKDEHIYIDDVRFSAKTPPFYTDDENKNKSDSAE